MSQPQILWETLRSSLISNWNEEVFAIKNKIDQVWKKILIYIESKACDYRTADELHQPRFIEKQPVTQVQACTVGWRLPEVKRLKNIC